MEDSKKIIQLLEAQLKFQLSPILEKEFQDPKKKKLFELTGKFSIRELEKKVGYNKGTISKIWSTWELKGIIRKDGQVYKRIF